MTKEVNVKKAIYIFFCAILGLILSFIAHAVLEMMIINLLVSDFQTYGLGLSWETWFIIHAALTPILVLAGIAFGNGIFVAVPNRVGHEPHPGGDGIEFWGQSFLVDPAGRVLARASADREEILVVPCDLDAIDVARTHWPFLRDRRIDAYGDIVRRYAD